MAHGVVRTDLLDRTDVRSEIVSVRYKQNSAFVDIDNGNVLVLGDLESNSRTVHTGATPSASSNLSDVVLIASPEMMYDEHVHRLESFYNESGKIARGYRLHEHDIFSVTIEALDAAGLPKVGDIVELGNGTKLKVVKNATNGSTTVGRIIDINTIGNIDGTVGIHVLYVIEVAASNQYDTDNICKNSTRSIRLEKW